MTSDELADHTKKRAEGRQRFIVAVAGPPGAGKSTLAEQLLGSLQKKSVQARVIPMDGFHLDNSILSKRGLLDRKGSPATFDAAGLLNLIRRMASTEGDVVYPTFDREKDITIAGAESVSAKDKILIIEGNYLLLKDTPWNELQQFWDETIFINPGVEVLEKRLVVRWLDYGLDDENARNKALINDIPNAHYVLENSVPADIQIK